MNTTPPLSCLCGATAAQSVRPDAHPAQPALLLQQLVAERVVRVVLPDFAAVIRIPVLRVPAAGELNRDPSQEAEAQVGVGQGVHAEDDAVQIGGWSVGQDKGCRMQEKKREHSRVGPAPPDPLGGLDTKPFLLLAAERAVPENERPARAAVLLLSLDEGLDEEALDVEVGAKRAAGALGLGTRRGVLWVHHLVVAHGLNVREVEVRDEGEEGAEDLLPSGRSRWVSEEPVGQRARHSPRSFPHQHRCR